MSPISAAPDSSVAVVGMAVLLPRAPDLDTYWSNLVGGIDAISDCPSWRWDPEYYAPADAGTDPAGGGISCRRGGFVDEHAVVDVTRFGLAPSCVADAEPDHLLALAVAAEAVEDAGGRDRLGPADRVGVIIGRGGYTAASTIRFLDRVRGSRQLARTFAEVFPDAPDAADLLRQTFGAPGGQIQQESATSPLSNLCASRIANRLDLGGPAYTLDAACASSLLAVDQAVGELTRGRCDVVLAGGVHHVHEAAFWTGFSQLGALSRSQTIRPFDRRADGTLLGEGTGVVVLKRLADAERHGDRIYAVIRGIGVASDGRGTALLAPNPDGQARAVTAAWRAAGLDPTQPGQLGLLEAHGTATTVGDRAELHSLGEVFGGPAHEIAPALGSVKSMIGHAMPAAGIAGLVKAALAVYHGIIPPTLNCEEPSPELQVSRFRVTPTAEPWPDLPTGVPRRAGVNAFGFGGINSHVVLEQAPGEVIRAAIGWPGLAGRPPGAGVPVASVREPDRILRLAAPTVEALLDQVELLDRAARPPAVEGLLDGPVRLGLMDPAPERLQLARRILQRGEPWRGARDVWFTDQPLHGPATPSRLAFVFPGLEGDFAPRTQSLGRRFDHSRSADGDVLAGDGLGPGGLATNALGEWLDALLRSCGVVPDDVAGFSLGEWTAMRTVGVLPEDAVQRLTRFLARNAMPSVDVAFAIVAIDAETLSPHLERFPGVVISHESSPRQTVVCGPDDALTALLSWCREQRIMTTTVPIRSGFHTPSMAPQLAAIDAFVGSLGEARARLWSTTLAAPAPGPEPELRGVFLRHLVEPVRWHRTVTEMYGAGVRAFVQVGVGQLGVLVADSLAGSPALIVSAASNNRDILHQLGTVLTGLWVEGWPVEPEQVTRPAAARSTTMSRIDLGTPFRSLDTPTRQQLRASVRPFAGCPDGPAARSVAALESALGELTTSDSAILTEGLLSFLHTTSDSATQVLQAATGSATGTGRGSAAGTGSPGATAVEPAAPVPATLPVSVETMPYLRDHCFFRQRPDWPDEADLWPVMPATTAVHHMLELAGAAAGGRPAVLLENLRLLRWLSAVPATDVDLTVRQVGPERWQVRLGDYSGSEVTTAHRYPAEAPQPWQIDLATEGVTEHTAQQLYERRILFHGPAFRGIREVTGIGPAHIRGVLVAPGTPGALLDSAGQLFGYWIMQTLTTRSRVLPAGIRRLELFGPHPEPGCTVECLVRIDAVTEETVEAGVQLLVGGRVWAQAEGWLDRRFDDDASGLDVVAWAERRVLSQARPEGWFLMHERWFEAASRELAARRWLGSAEREHAQRLPGLQRRAHLLGCIAVKDAVRSLMWADGAGDIFPAEIQVTSTGDSTWARGVHGRCVPPLQIALAQEPQLAVALVRPAQKGSGAGPGTDIPPGTGIALELVPPSPTVTGGIIPEVSGPTASARQEGDRDSRVRARLKAGLRAARRAVASAAGVDAEEVDPLAVPEGTVVPASDADAELVMPVRLRRGQAGRTEYSDGRTEYSVGLRCVVSPPDDWPSSPRATRREYVVAWTR